MVGFIYPRFKTRWGQLCRVEIVAPSLTVSDRLVLDLGRRHLELIAWKTSHSDCDLTIMDQTSGTLFTGDLLFLRHVPVVDGSLLGFLEVAEQLAAIPAKEPCLAMALQSHPGLTPSITSALISCD